MFSIMSNILAQHPIFPTPRPDAPAATRIRRSAA
jgi:hypothetical protein